MIEYILGTPLQACEGLGEGDILPAGTRITVTGERVMIPHKALCAVISANEKKYLTLNADLNAALKNARTVEV